jgi:deoxyribodipyrimidine photolyase-related protein
MSSFYIEQRKRLKLLLDGAGPLGGKWSFDTENRKKLPKKTTIPEALSRKLFSQDETNFVNEATEYVNEHFADNPGETEHFEYPINHTEAKKVLRDFLSEKIYTYGDYQDSIDTTSSFLFHSVLTPSLNIGLIHPQTVIQEVLKQHQKKEIPMNSLEGFLRQVIGWREFTRGVYQLKGRFQRTKNFFGHTRKIPPSFWNASTGILPLDNVLQRVIATGYGNHIERLMVFSNFMLLCEFDPDEVYEWFMSLFIDSYDWVMVPNVYGMGQYADGGLMITKPYISSSNYIRKMSHFKQEEWATIWDALYWRFMKKHRALFEKNPRTRMTTKHLDTMGKEKLKSHLQTAEKFLKTL